VKLDGPDGYLRVSEQINANGRLLFTIRSSFDLYHVATEIPIEGLAELRDHLDKLLEGEIS
jgi:ubiquinone biosynthesis protein Coq4